MAASIVGFLDALSAKVFWASVAVFLVLNGAAIAAFVVTRSRRLVDTWTPRLVAADLTLLAAGLGVPLASGLAKFGVNALASMLGTPQQPVP